MQIPNARGCSAAGSIGRGMNCGENLTGRTWELSFAETIDFIEAQEARECVPVVEGMAVCADHPAPGASPVAMEKRAGAICRSAEDDQKIHTALEQACRKLGPGCTYEIRRALGIDP